MRVARPTCHVLVVIVSLCVSGSSSCGSPERKRSTQSAAPRVAPHPEADDRPHASPPTPRLWCFGEFGSAGWTSVCSGPSSFDGQVSRTPDGHGFIYHFESPEAPLPSANDSAFTVIATNETVCSPRLGALAEQWPEDGWSLTVLDPRPPSERALDCIRRIRPASIAGGRLASVLEPLLPSGIGRLRLEIGARPGSPVSRPRSVRQLAIRDPELRGVTDLPELRTLDVMGALDEAGWAQLEQLTELERLAVHGGNLSAGREDRLAHIADLTSLRVLDLSSTRLTDASLTHLEALTGLRELDLAMNQLGGGGLVHLRGLTGLRVLRLDDNYLGRLGILASFTNLEVLSLARCLFDGSELSHLVGLTRLRELHLEDTRVEDADVAVLAEMSGLELHVASDRVSDATCRSLPGVRCVR